MAIWGGYAPLLQGAAQQQAANNYSLVCNSGSYSLTGQSATLNKSKSVVASSGSYAVTGQSATIVKVKTYSITAQSGSYSLTGQTANLVKGRVLTSNAGSYAVSGQTATLKKSKSVNATSGSYSLTGQSATITKVSNNAYVLTALSGSYSLSGQSAVIDYSGATQVTGGSGNGKSKRVYLEEDGKVLVFANASRAAAYLAQKKQQDASETAQEAPQRTVTKKAVPKPQKKEAEPLQVISIDVLKLLSLQYGYEDTLSPILRQHEYAALIALYEQVLRDRDEEEVLMLLIA